MRRAAVGLGVVLAVLGAAGRAGATRLRVALVLDGSQSMRQQDPALLARVAAKLLVDLAGPQDEISVVEFGTNGVPRGAGNGGDKDALFAAIDSVTRDQWCTDWAAGLEAALASFAGPRPAGERRLLVLLTDGAYDPNRADPRYFTTDEARAAVARITARDRAFAEHPCARSSAALAALAEAPFLERVRALATGPLRERGVQVFPIGFGTELGGNSLGAEKSRALLREIAQRTGGTALVARSSQDLPGFFASVFAALVGAPVEPPLELTGESTTFEVHPGARAVTVVVPTADAALRIEATGAHVVRKRDDYHEAGTPPEGYRLLDLGRAAPGRVTLRRVGGEGAPPRAWVIQDLGLRLGLEAPPATVPQGTHVQVAAALVTADGTPIALSPEFLRDVTIELEYDGVRVPFPLVGAERATRDCGVPPPGHHHVSASARHAGGLLAVEDVSRDIDVVRQIDVALGGPPLAFRTKAVPDFAARTTVGVVRGTLPIPQRYRVDWSGVSSVSDLEVEPAGEITLAAGQPPVELRVRLRDHEGLRSESRQFRGVVKLTATEPHFYRGPSEWTVAVDGTLEPWTLADWWALYRTRILIGLGVFFLLFWIVGRLAASSFPAKARLYYHRPDEPESAASSVRLAQSTSLLPFRSARHAIGRGGKPRAAKRHCCLVATRRGFRVVPADSAVIEKADDGTEQERKAAFEGRHDVRYRTGDFVFWVSRAGEPPA